VDQNVGYEKNWLIEHVEVVVVVLESILSVASQLVDQVL